MATPLPLAVHGPITPASPAVRVTGVLESAQVSVRQDGAVIGQAIAPANGELWVPLAQKPAVGKKVDATQKTPQGESEPSGLPVTVVDLPDPLPTPVIASALHTCMADVWVANLVPGAKLIAQIGGQLFADPIASAPAQWAGLAPSLPIATGSTLSVRQEVAGTPLVSPTVTSLPLPGFTRPAHLLPPPKLAEPLKACDTARTFVDAIGGATSILDNEGQVQHWPNPSNAFGGFGGHALKQGKMKMRQVMPRCGIEGALGESPVHPPEQPPPPQASQDLCPKTLRLQLTNLVPGGTLRAYRSVQTSPGGTSGTLLGEMGIHASSQPLDLPPTFAFTDPAGPVSLELSQMRCGLGSTRTFVPVTSPAGPYPAPKIDEPAFDCARGLRISNAHVGAMVQAFDASTQLPLGDPAPVLAAKTIVRTWFGLVAGRKVFVRQSGCNADGDSPVVRVEALPDPLPVPEVIAPIRPGAGFVNVKQALPGAVVQLMVNNVARSPGIEVWSDPASVWVPPPALADQQNVFAVQFLCDKSSAREGRGVTVTRGQLHVDVTPSTVTRGSTSQVTVSARDADTGAPVNAQILLNGTPVGWSGQPFAFSPKLGDAPPAGVARESVGYFDKPFSIGLADPMWTLTLGVSPPVLYFHALKITIDAVTFEVTPDWNPALKRTLSGQPSGSTPSLVAATALPVPAGSVKTVTVAMTYQWSTAGGAVDEYHTAEPASGADAATIKVAYANKNHTAGWLLHVLYLYDPQESEGIYKPAILMNQID